ncbi:MAG TPA: DNA mismatch repair protein MutS [Longimicrobiales bacterium]
MAKPEDTPLMQQWRDAKSRHPDALIFFRVGDFYEMFCEDAEEGARLLGLTLTSRNNGGAAHVPLAGVPVRARDEYLERLIRLGRRVAVCEQVEDPVEAKGIVRREVVETITPGALLSDALLSERRNNFLVALARADQQHLALCAVDASTGEVIAALIDAQQLEAELARYEPAELLLPQSWALEPFDAAPGVSRTYRADWLFDRDLAAEELKRRFRVLSLDGFGFQPDDAPMISALGALVAYVAEVQPAAIEALRAPRIERFGTAMALDEMTRRNLELVEPLRTDPTDKGRAATLIEVLDETLTGMGARLLRRWLLRPLIAPEDIWARHDAVAELLDNAALRRAVREELRQIRDLGRLAGKVAAARVTPRELKSLNDSLERFPRVRAVLEPAQTVLLRHVAELDLLNDVRELIERALSEDAPASLAEGGAIRSGFDAELDELRNIRDGAQDFIASLQVRERERSGISSLKVGYNKVFGYFLEITRANIERVPADYERKQTLANAERYVTAELKELEAKILGAEEKITEVEARLFAELRKHIARDVARLQASADRIALLDVLSCLAHVAERRGYVRPTVHTGYELALRGARHPVVETMMPREDFIPNDVLLNEEGRIIILTGPNMAGKSTLLRQVGLIQLMAQIGSFVPASEARVPVCDRIFTRVGASDNLVRGQSTFMVEMHETAAILHNATMQSLVLLDEIGRGTATYDGVSIAWAVTEYLHDHCGCKTIFATHYHELTQLSDFLPALINFNVAVKEVGHDIVFLHHLQPGGADRSYGIDVGRLAGLPAGVVQRARAILHQLEGAHSGSHFRPASSATSDQLSLFHVADAPIVERIKRADVNAMTPIQAMNVLSELKQMLEDAR